MTDYDRWKTEPPEDSECPYCAEQGEKAERLVELVEWVAGNRFYWPATLPGQPFRVSLMPYTNGDTVCEGATRYDALEKLWRLHE